MPTIDLGKVVGEQGPTGERGSVWYTGTGVTGTETSGTVMPSSEVENARVNDMYLNSSTSDTYMCVFPGDANTAQWAWSGNIKGDTGNPGPAGPTGSVDENTPIPFTQAILRENIASNEAIAIMFGKIAKWFNDFGTAAWASVVNNGTTFSEGTVLDGRMGKALTDSIGTLTNLETTEKSSLVGAINELTNAISELNGKLQWKNLTGVEGVLANQMIYYDDIYDQISEIHVVVQWTINETISRQSKTFLKSDLTSQGAYFILGGYHSNSFYQFCEIMANKNGIRMNSAMQNGINFTTSAKMWVRYR